MGVETKMRSVGYGLELRTKKVKGIDINILSESKVAVFGVGNLGTRIARNLAKLGFRLRLVDRDRVGNENIGYQDLFAGNDVGEWKAETAALKLKETHPWLDVEHYEFEIPYYGGSLENIEKRAKLTDKLVSGSDLSIVSFDSWNPRITVLLASVIHQKPFISVGVEESEANISVWIPNNNDSCLICYTRHIARRAGLQTYVANPNVSELVSSLTSQYAVMITNSLKVPNFTYINFGISNILEFYHDKANPTCPLCSDREALLEVYRKKGLLGGLEWLVSRI
jgi:molybdopterin/thiamine biosynthesis adenylyltransferase